MLLNGTEKKGVSKKNQHGRYEARVKKRESERNRKVKWMNQLQDKYFYVQ